jgi:peptidoglycan hydrolase CwlO-like protein
MANLSQLQMPSIDTGQLSGKDGKKIKSYLFQIQEMLRYALNDIDEDNLSEELRSKIESGGLSSEISQALDAITLRVTGLDDAQAELKLTAEGLTSQVEAQGGRISTLEQTATSITARVETAEGDITTLEQTATSLTGRIESAEGDINTLTATATGLEGRIESAEGSITTLTATADGLSTRVESAEGNITSLTQTAEGFGTRIETAEGDISSLQQTASGLTSRIETAEGDVTELQQTAGSLTGRIESAEGDITTLTATANGLTTRVESAEGDVTTIKQWADSLTLSVANGDSSSTIRLMAGSTEISSGSIGFTGVVTFSDLSTWQQDKTIINGGNITTGQIHNSDYSTVYDLDNAWIRMGASDGNRVYIDKSGIQWYGGTATSSGMSQGVIQNGLKTTTEGDTTIFCADTRYQKYGWWHDSSFQGITIEQVDNSVGCSGKLEVNQGIQCRSLSAWDAKNRIVRTDFGNLAINAVESPEPMFCDAGSGECDETGLCYIATEPRYRETVSETQDLRWALTPTGASAALWAEKTAFGAIVHGPAGQCFDWVCWGVQRGFEGVYADVSDAKYPEEENRGAALLDAAETEAAVSLPLTIEEAS